MSLVTAISSKIKFPPQPSGESAFTITSLFFPTCQASLVEPTAEYSQGMGTPMEISLNTASQVLSKPSKDAPSRFKAASTIIGEVESNE